MSTEKKSFLKRTGRFSIATIISRLTGLLREATLAALFGASGSMDAFVAAFRIPNLLRDLFAEGALSAAYVPVFTEKLKKEGPREAFQVTSTVISILVVVVGALVVIGIITAPYFVKYCVSGFSDDPGKMQLTVLMSQIMFPFILLVALAAVLMGTLNSLGRFGIPALSPAIFNVITIIVALTMLSFFNPPILVLAVGVIIGGMGQFAVQIPQLRRQGYNFVFRFSFRDEAVQKILKLLVPAAIGVAAWQINVVVGTIIASHLDSGSISNLYYALRLMHFPLGVFGVALATVSLPELSAQVAAGEIKSAGASQRFSSRMVIFLLLPSAAYLLGASEAVVALAYERGHFTLANTVEVAKALRAYSVGLIFFGLVRVTAQVFYSFMDTATPVKISIAAVLANIVLSLLFMGPLGFSGLALATSIAAIINFSLLYKFSGKKLPRPDRFGLIKFSFLIGIPSLLCGLGAYWITRAFWGTNGFGGLLNSLAATVLSAMGGGAVFIFLCWAMKIDELKLILGIFRKGTK